MIGVMQGRLLPKYKGRYQAHPVDYWQEEFDIASDLELDLIEFIFDFNDADKNPLMHKCGLNEIQRLSEDYGVSVKSICADYFMEAPLHSLEPQVVEESQQVLRKLIINASSIGIRDLVIPCVDQSSLVNGSIEAFVKNIYPVLELAEKYCVNLALETDFAPGPFAELLERFDTPRVTVNYDIGNSVSLGYDQEEEFAAYGDRITDIHIKDRVCGGGSVMLGEGDADFEQFFTRLSELDYTGPFIMQAYRDNEGVSVFKSQLRWLSRYLDETNR